LNSLCNLGTGLMSLDLSGRRRLWYSGRLLPMTFSRNAKLASSSMQQQGSRFLECMKPTRRSFNKWTAWLHESGWRSLCACSDMCRYPHSAIIHLFRCYQSSYKFPSFHLEPR
jgi:hypothetical protein